MGQSWTYDAQFSAGVLPYDVDDIGQSIGSLHKPMSLVRTICSMSLLEPGDLRLSGDWSHVTKGTLDQGMDKAIVPGPEECENHFGGFLVGRIDQKAPPCRSR